MSECEVQPEHDLNLLQIKGYELHVAQTFESRTKGRILAFTKEGQKITRHSKFEEKFNDILVFKHEKTFIIGVYSGFKTYENETVLSNFQRLLDNLTRVVEKDKTKNVLIGGDFNADPKRPCFKSKLLDIWQTENGLTQLVTETTRMRLVDSEVQQSMIDLVFVGDIPETNVELCASEVSDHHLLIAKINQVTPPRIKFQKKTVIDWRNFDPLKMDNIITRELSDIEFCERVDSFDRDLTIAISTALNVVIPKRTIHLRRDDNVVSYNLEAIKKKRDRHIKMARKTGEGRYMVKVKELDKLIKKTVKTERDKIIKAKMKSSSPKTFWTAVNTLLGRTQSMEDEVVLRNENDEEITGDAAAQMFAMFFKEKVDKLLAKNKIEDEQTVLHYQPIEPFTCSEIRDALSSFKPKKSSGPDEIPLVVLKKCFDSLERPIKHLLYTIARYGKLPVSWKCARIKPILKKGDKTKVENYRPISNLNSVSKLFER